MLVTSCDEAIRYATYRNVHILCVHNILLQGVAKEQFIEKSGENRVNRHEHK